MEETNGKVLIVDDIETNRIILQEYLQDTYQVEQAENGYEAVAKILHGERLPDIVLLDVMMPEIDGLEVFRIMKNNPLMARIPVIFITASGDNELMGLKMGAADYITKPFIPEAVCLRVNNCLELRRYREDLELNLEMKARTLTNLTENLLEILADIIEFRDVDSGQHVKRTSMLVESLIAEMLKKPKFYQQLNDLQYKVIIQAATMHDVGKIAIPDSILLKPGKLTAEEFEIVKEHTVIGGKIMDRLKGSCDDLYYTHGKNICLYHHERWDGRGYPMGLSGEEIPLAARIMSVVDVYDALVSKRPYKEPYDNNTALKIILDGAGGQFDPDIAELVTAWGGGS